LNIAQISRSLQVSNNQGQSNCHTTKKDERKKEKKENKRMSITANVESSPSTESTGRNRRLCTVNEWSERARERERKLFKFLQFLNDFAFVFLDDAQ
jgi:hypothetical protein